VDTDEDRIYDGLGRRGARVVTFARILKHNAIPLSAILNELFEICRRDLGFAVEIEFAVDLHADPSGRPEFYFLQMRPLVASRERCDIAQGSVPAAKLLCRSERVLGNGRIEGLRDIVYVEPAGSIAGKAPKSHRKWRRSTIGWSASAGPICSSAGTLGSFDPWIGIPVTWHQISGARVIVEVPASDLPIEPSQGTHFFHNMTSAGIGYFSLSGTSENEFVRWELLDSLPGRADRAGRPACPPRQPLSRAHGWTDPEGDHTATLRGDFRVIGRTPSSTGLPALDRILGGLIAGDNVVWQVGSIEDYLPFVRPYCEMALRQGRKLVYFQFERHGELIPRTRGSNATAWTRRPASRP